MGTLPPVLALGVCTRPASAAEFTLKVRRSEFIAALFPAADAEAARAVLEEIRRRHFSAAHHCPAWRTGFPATEEFCSDDGEPSGTAGRPILGELKKVNLCNAAVVVTRYFGGVKLGVRGLIEAYSAAAAGAVRKAVLEKCGLFRALTLRCGYSELSAVSHLLKTMGIPGSRYRVQYGQDVLISAQVAASLEASAAEKLSDFSSRQLLAADPLWGGTELLVLKDGE